MASTPHDLHQRQRGVAAVRHSERADTAAARPAAAQSRAVPWRSSDSVTWHDRRTRLGLVRGSALGLPDAAVEHRRPLIKVRCVGPFSNRPRRSRKVPPRTRPTVRKTRCIGLNGAWQVGIQLQIIVGLTTTDAFCNSPCRQRFSKSPAMVNFPEPIFSSSALHTCGGCVIQR